MKAGKAVLAERKKWQAKGKALPVEMVPNATQTQPEEEVVKPTPAMAEVSIKTVEMRQEENGTQREAEVEELGEAMRRKKNKNRNKDKGKIERRDEDTVMKDGFGGSNTDRYREYEGLSSYEEEDETLMVVPPATKKQTAQLSAAKAGKKSRPAKTPYKAHPQKMTN